MISCALTQWLPWNNSYLLLYHRLDKKASLSDTSWLPVMSLFILGLKEKNICFIKQHFVVILHLLRNFFNLIGWGKTYLNLIDLTDRIEQKLARKIIFFDNICGIYTNYRQHKKSCFSSHKAAKALSYSCKELAWQGGKSLVILKLSSSFVLI